MAQRGKFIVFEGLDGSGKSTQLRTLERRLHALGRTVFRTAEPTGGDIGRSIREALSGEKPRSTAVLAALPKFALVAGTCNVIKKFISF